MSSVLFLVVLLLDQPVRGACKVWISANIYALGIVLALSSLLYPFGLLEWIGDLLQQAVEVTKRTPDRDGFLGRWFFNPHKPLHGFVVVTAAAALGRAALARSVRSACFVSYGMAMMLVWYMSVRIPALEYNAAAFVPVLVALGIDRLATQDPDKLTWLKFCGYLVAVGSVIAIGVVFQSLLSGTDRRTFLSDLLQLQEEGDVTIILPPPFLVGAVPFSQWGRYQLTFARGGTCPTTAKTVVFVKQANSGRFVPPKLAGCELVVNKFSKPLALFGWQIPLVPRSYGYAIYRLSS
jgi:hypothetical protein